MRALARHALGRSKLQTAGGISCKGANQVGMFARWACKLRADRKRLAGKQFGRGQPSVCGRQPNDAAILDHRVKHSPLRRLAVFVRVLVERAGHRRLVHLCVLQLELLFFPEGPNRWQYGQSMGRSFENLKQKIG